MKRTYYFSHDYNARNDRKMMCMLMKKGIESIGIYWCVIEMLYEENGYLLRDEYERITFELRTNYDLVKFVIESSNLFHFDDEKFWSESVLDRLNLQNEKSVKATESINKRWEKYERNTNVIRTKYEGNTIKEKKRKEIIKSKNDKNAPGGANVVFSKQRDFYSDQIEQSKTTREQKILKRYESFVEYLFETNPLKRPLDHILSIPIQLSFADYYKLLAETSKKDKDLKPFLDIIVNTPKYAQGRESLYLTLLGFINRA